MRAIKWCVLGLSFLMTIGVSRPALSIDAVDALQTGLEVLDIALNETSARGASRDGERGVIEEISFLFGLSPNTIRALRREGFSYGEIYYLALLSRETTRPTRYLVLERNRGIGWGVLAHRLGVHPRRLNQTRVALLKRTELSDNRDIVRIEPTIIQIRDGKGKIEHREKHWGKKKGKKWE